MSLQSSAEIFKALGDETRLKIITIIAAGGSTLCVGAIAQCLKVSQPAVSQHLRVLKNAGLVEANRVGFRVHYSLISGSMDELGIDIAALLEKFQSEPWIESCCRRGIDGICSDAQGKSS